MSDTLCVLALDAADYRLVRQWGCDNILQATHSPLETFSHSHPWPLTSEVWPTVATGLHPEEHGLSEIEDARNWDSSTLVLASQVTKFLPIGVRKALGRLVRLGGAEQSLDQTDTEHPFDAVNGWPGLSPARRLNRAWSLMDDVNAGRISDAEFREQMRLQTAEAFGWLASKADSRDACVGVHCHILDVAGHVYAQRPESLRRTYEWVDTQVGWVRGACDRLLILSDHGMLTAATDDADPGVHSEEALISASDSIEADPPTDVFDVADWLRTHSQPTTESAVSPAAMDVSTEHLRNLGYID